MNKEKIFVLKQMKCVYKQPANCLMILGDLFDVRNYEGGPSAYENVEVSGIVYTLPIEIIDNLSIPADIPDYKFIMNLESRLFGESVTGTYRAIRAEMSKKIRDIIISLR